MPDDLTPTNPQMPVAGDDRCPTCGAPFPASARFCPNCGQARAEADAPGDTDATRVMAPVAAPVVEEDVHTRAAPAVVRERPWPWALTLGVPAAILLLLLIVLAVRSLDSGDDDAPPETTTTSVAPSTTATTSRPAVTRAPATTPQTSPPQTSPPQTSPPETQPPETQPPASISVP